MGINPVIRINQKFDEGNDIAFMINGEDKYLYDTNGKKYIDFCGGIWNVPFGYSCPEIMESIIEQGKKIPFCNLITNIADIQYNYALRLNTMLGTAALIYTCSGSESNEAAIKACRKYQALKNRKRKTISAFNLSYHGTTYGAMSISGIDQKCAEDFFPLIDEIEWITLPEDQLEDENAWVQAIEEHFEKYAAELAGVIIEPVFGSGGIVSFPTKALKRLEELCNEHDVLLVDDEVTTGFGRTGVPFAFQQHDVKPDLICLSKGITNGFMPLGVLAFSEKVCDAFVKKGATFEHFSTQGGNLLSIAAADAVLDYMQNYESYQVAEKGEYFKNYLTKLFASYKEISVRGKGLMIGISFSKNLDERRLLEVWEKLKRQGLLVYIFLNQGYNLGLSFFPPFTSTKEELKDVADKVFKVLKRYPDILC